MSSVVISGNTSGSITLSAPDVSGSNTITLPASTGTVLTTGSPQSGGVIQVVQAVKSDTFTTASGSYVDVTGLSASITPKFSTSTILVMVNIGCLSASSTNIRLNLVRGSTSIYQGTLSGTINQASINFDIPNSYGASSVSLAYVDSPATTSSTT